MPHHKSVTQIYFSVPIELVISELVLWIIGHLFIFLSALWIYLQVDQATILY